jgi:PAS domain S-box-containing protein
MTTDRVLRAITDLQPGDHLGFLYQTEAEHRALLTPFLRQGLERGEKVVYIMDVHPAETILDYLRDEGLEVEPYLARGQLRLMTPAETFLRTGVFNPDDMIAFWQTETERALAEGYQALRAAGELTWALQDLPDPERLFEFESKLSAFLPGTKFLAVCLYEGSRLDSEMLFNVLTTHPAVATDAEIHDNFYYLPPADLVQGSLPMAVLRYWLKTQAERKRTEEALKASEARYRAIVEDQTEFICRFSPDGLLTFVNEAYCRYFGRKREDLIGRSLMQFIPQENQADLKKHLASLNQENPVTTREGWNVQPGGELRWLEWTNRAIFDEQGHLVEFQAVGRDITERKQVEEALRESEERYRSLVEVSPDVIALTNLDATVTMVNQQATRLFGYERAEEMIGKSAFDFIASQERSRARENLQRTLAMGRVRDIEYVLLKKDGTRFPAELSASLIRDLEGKPKAFMAVLRDITGRKRAEEEVRRHTAQMEALAEISQALAEVGLDVQAVLETIVRYTAEVIGDVSRLTLLSSDEQWFQPVAFHHSNPEVKAQMEAIYPFTPISASTEWYAHILRTGQPALIPIVDQEQFKQRVQPEYLPFFEQVGVHSILVVPLRVEGRVIGALGLSRDQAGRSYTPDDQVLLQDLADRAALTIENARLFEQVQDARERLQALSRRLLEVQETERRHIARELHDEVGQVLTGLKLLLDMNGRLPAETAKSHLSEAQQLINELMERVDELSLDLRPAMLDDLGLLPTLLGHFERYTQRTQIQVTFQQTGLAGRRFSPDIETTVYRLIQEALTNVARHAEVSEVTIRLWVGLDTLGVEIVDRGIGFDPRSTGASTGLSGMRERVVLLGGQLAIESAPGRGTYITAEVPLSEATQRSDC